MNSSRSTLLRPHFRTAILILVGLLGLLATVWVTKEVWNSAENQFDQRFQRAAHERTDRIIRSFEEPLNRFVVLQHLFHSVGEVDPALFDKFVGPMNRQAGIRGFAWAPLVTFADRDAFEHKGRQLWGESFALSELDANGKFSPATKREHYFPVIYNQPSESSGRIVGLDMLSHANCRPSIERAINEDRLIASGIGASVMDRTHSGKVVVFVAPVYRGGVAPATREERRAAVRGLLLAGLDGQELFAVANEDAPHSGLRASLFDHADSSSPVLTWRAVNDTKELTASDKPLKYTRSLELAGQVWTVQLEAGPEWRAENAPNSMALAPAVGVLLTILLLLYMNRLLGPSESVGSRELVHEEDLEKQRAVEGWARKLSMVVEQNPATILMTDLEGRIEYVNDKFIEVTGYTREESIGQNVNILRSETTSEAVYRNLWDTLSNGKAWQGEFQSKRRDGGVNWERALISPIRDNDGAITNYVAIKEDISELRELMKRLQESETRFRGAVSVMVEGLAIISPDGLFIFGNKTLEEYLGCADEGIQGLTLFDIKVERLREDGSVCPPEEYPTFVSLREGREIRDCVMGLRAADGTVRWVQINTSPLRIGEAQKIGVVMTFSDVTERRRSEGQLKLAFEAIRQSGEGILVTDAEHRIISLNPAVERVTGYSIAELEHKSLAVIASARYDERFYTAMREVLDATGYWQGEIWNQRKNGEEYPEWLGVSVVREADGRPKYYVYIFSDMTERHEVQRRIEFLAHHDPLTELPNRLLLRDRVEQAQAQAGRMHSRVALMLLDLDRFKTINDSLGHPVGDALLKAVAERLKDCVRDSDTISRQGGDEFILLLNDVRDSDAVSRVADKIHQRMAEPLMVGEHSLTASFSIGIALYPDDGADFDSLLQKADTAMYHAKETGRNSHRFFTKEMNQKVVEHLTLENQLRNALENKEFVLHYQPQLDLQEGKIVGVEALIRWNNPEQGLVSPARFIPVAEESGLIVAIGAWVINEACRQARAWQNAGLPPFVVAVNLSAVQFRRQDLVNTVINALVLSDLDSQWLELELTESILIQDAEVTLDTVRRLKALGIKLSVDDFGTGYSSLTYLKRFAVDKLKIDQSFVRDLVTDPDDAAIVRAIIQMAHSLKLKTIAEGVETEELSNLLRLFHCDEIQGYWFARPMPADALEAFVRNHPAKNNESRMEALQTL